MNQNRIELKRPQREVFLSPHRFRLLVAGRRFGKTYLANVELFRAASGAGRKAWYVAPTYRQAKRIAWAPLKELTRPYWASKPQESDLRIELQGGGTIALRGADSYDSLRGEGLDFVVLDEYASMAPAAWNEVLRPALADRKGGALFIGTPRGFNHFYDLYEGAQSQRDWATFHFSTEEGGNVAVEELQSAARELDERVYRQEFRASFENLTSGRVYYAFDRRDVKPVEYDPRFPLCWSLDFNIDPASSVLCQIVHGHVYVLDEIVLRDASTYDVCQEFARRTKLYVESLERYRSLAVSVYGDATGESRRSAASRTDWQIVRDFFTRHPGDYHAVFKVRSRNPELKDRINCVNAIISNANRERRLTVSPKCKQLIRDLQQVSWKSDANGNPIGDLDRSDRMRTHTSDALGYLTADEFPMRARVGEMPYSLLGGGVFR
jgi:Terminase large subunit, T4likevirus-type, N-terminal